MTLLLWLLACGPSNPTPAPDAPEVEAEAPAPKAAPTADYYVLASRLNLRDAPGGNKIGRLNINSPLQVVEEKDDQVKVTIANGKQGWVPKSFLSKTPTTITSALAASDTAANAEERLAWAQRAAALDFRSRDALTALAAAYRETGDFATAARIESQLAWPDDLLLAGAHYSSGDQLTLEWATVPWEQMDRMSLEVRQLTTAEAKRQGVTVGDPVWVLPSSGPAVKGKIEGMELTIFNECGGEWGYVIRASAAVPEGERVLAYTIETPPESWSKPAPTVDEARITQLVKAKLPKKLGEAELHMAARGDKVLVRAAGDVSSDTDDMPTFAWVDFEVDVAKGKVKEVGSMDDYNSYIGYDYPAASRDFDGDGNLDVFYEGSCMMSLVDHEGTTRASTSMLCCGC